MYSSDSLISFKNITNNNNNKQFKMKLTLRPDSGVQEISKLNLSIKSLNKIAQQRHLSQII